MTPPVPLAKLALDGAGRVSVDESARRFSGVRLPGRAADPPTVRTSADGDVALTGTLTVSGNLGVGTDNPGARLDVRSDATTIGGWFEAIRLSRAEHSAITHPGGGLMLGLHSNRNFYFSDISSAQAHKHVLVVEADTGNVGIGTDPGARLHVKGGKVRLDGNQQLLFDDGDITNNLKVQLWSGYGLGINGGTLFYAADGRHSWRDANGTNERMALTTALDGGLTVSGTGASSFAGSVGVGVAAGTALEARLSVAWFRAAQLAGTAHSQVLRTSAAALGNTPGAEVALSSFGLTVSNHMSLGVRALRTAAGTDWTSTAIGLGMDVFLHANGRIGIGTASPGAKLEILGGGGMSVDLLVNGRLRSNSNDGGLWIVEDRFVGGHSTSQLGFYNSGWRLSVDAGGNVGIGTTNTGGQRLRVAGGSTWLEGDLFVGGGLRFK